MKIMKKVSIMLIILAGVVLAISSNVFAATKDEIIQSILENVVIKMTEASNNGDPTYVTDSTKINEIALYWKQQAEANGIKMQEFIDYDSKYLRGNILGDTSTSLYLCYKEANENSNLEEQVKDPNKTNDEKKNLADSIRQKASVGLANMSTADLKALDTLLNQFRTTYQSEWNAYNKEYRDLYDMATEIHDEVAKRRDEGDSEIPDDYQGTLDNQVSDRNDEQENLKDKGTLGVLGGSSIGSLSPTPDKIIGNAQDFKNAGNATIPIDGDNIKEGSSSLYNILLSIAFFLAVAIGMYLGVKMMLANAEDKAKIKEALIPYIAGCVVIFGAFAIWKLAITLLSGIG